MTSEEATTELRNILRVEQNRIHKDFVLIGALKMAVKALQKQRTGRWFDIGSMSCRCSECGCKNNRENRYCPNCGAKMEGIE